MGDVTRKPKRIPNNRMLHMFASHADDREVLDKIVGMIGDLNTKLDEDAARNAQSYREIVGLVRAIDENMMTAIRQHDASLSDHRCRIINLEEDVQALKKVVGI